MVGEYSSALDALLTSPEESSEGEAEPVTFNKASEPKAKSRSSAASYQVQGRFEEGVASLATFTEDEEALKKIEKKERRITREEKKLREKAT